MKMLLMKLRLVARGELVPKKRESGSLNIAVLAPSRSGMSFVDSRLSRATPSERRCR